MPLKNMKDIRELKKLEGYGKRLESEGKVMDWRKYNRAMNKETASYADKAAFEKEITDDREAQYLAKQFAEELPYVLRRKKIF